jgi:hypothetical protein
MGCPVEVFASAKFTPPMPDAAPQPPVLLWRFCLPCESVDALFLMPSPPPMPKAIAFGVYLLPCQRRCLWSYLSRWATSIFRGHPGPKRRAKRWARFYDRAAGRGTGCVRHIRHIFSAHFFVRPSRLAVFERNCCPLFLGTDGF